METGSISLAATIKSMLVAGMICISGVSSPCAEPFSASAPCEPAFTPAAAGGGLPMTSARLSRGRKLQILAIGSSSTFGIGASAPGKAYPAQLQKILRSVWGEDKVDVQNLGVSGETVTETLPRMKYDAQRLSPALVLWQLGTNDALGTIGLDSFQAEVEQGLEWLRESGSEVMLVGMQWTPALSKNGRYEAFNNRLTLIAARKNIPLVHRYEAMQAIGARGGIGAMLSSDNFHLSDTGYYCMASQAAKAILQRVPPLESTTVQTIIDTDSRTQSLRN